MTVTLTTRRVTPPCISPQPAIILWHIRSCRASGEKLYLCNGVDEVTVDQGMFAILIEADKTEVKV